ncbi:MAG: Capsid decoration protein, partial [candidate division TM6 bacterium GW2011_GWE2_41_16]
MKNFVRISILSLLLVFFKSSLGTLSTTMLLPEDSSTCDCSVGEFSMYDQKTFALFAKVCSLAPEKTKQLHEFLAQREYTKFSILPESIVRELCSVLESQPFFLNDNETETILKAIDFKEKVFARALRPSTQKSVGAPSRPQSQGNPVPDNIVVKGFLTVAGPTTLNGPVIVGQTTAFDDGIIVTGNTVLGNESTDTITMQGVTSIRGDTSIQGATHINSTGMSSTIIGNSLSATDFNGDVTFNQNVTCNAQALFNGIPTTIASYSPASIHDLATKQYVDFMAQGLNVLAPARVVATNNIVLRGEQIIDDIAVVDGNRVLAQNQSNAVHNGLWVANTSFWTRSTDYNGTTPPPNGVNPGGSYVYVQAGTLNAGSAWVCTSPRVPPLTIDTDPTTWAQFSSGSNYQMVNVGSGAGQVYKNQIGQTFNLRNIASGTNTNVSTTGDNVVVNVIDNPSIAGNTTIGGSLGVTGITTLANNVVLGSNKQLQLKDGTGAHYVALQAPNSVPSSFVLKLPGNVGSSGQVLTTDGMAGSANLSWQTPPSPHNAVTIGDPANGLAIDASQVLTLAAASETSAGAVTTDIQTISGDKTFTGNSRFTGSIVMTGEIFADNGIDVGPGRSRTKNGNKTMRAAPTGTLNLGLINAGIVNIATGAGPRIINLGNSEPGSQVNVLGTLSYQNVQNLNVTNKLITTNVGGSATTGSDCGLQVEEAGGVTGYVKTSGDRVSWAFEAPATDGVAWITPGATGFTINQGSHDPVTIGNANGLSIDGVGGQILSLATASEATTGALTPEDWTTFNNKQNSSPQLAVLASY